MEFSVYCRIRRYEHSDKLLPKGDDAPAEEHACPEAVGVTLEGATPRTGMTLSRGRPAWPPALEGRHICRDDEGENPSCRPSPRLARPRSPRPGFCPSLPGSLLQRFYLASHSLDYPYPAALIRALEGVKRCVYHLSGTCRGRSLFYTELPKSLPYLKHASP